MFRQTEVSVLKFQ